MLARLAGLDLDEVEDLLLAGQDEVVEAQEHGTALLERRARPGLLGVACAAYRRLDVLGRAPGHGAQQVAGERLLNLHPPAVALGTDPGGELLERGGGDAIGRDAS